MTTIEITQRHINQMNSICYKMVLAAPKSTKLMELDELQSEALVVLWELALSWEETQAPFEIYIQMMGKRRLIDRLRRDNGRDTHDHEANSRLNFMAKINSTDFATEEFRLKASHTPSPFRVAHGRENLRRVMHIINNVCSERQRDALLWPLTDGSPDAMCEKWNMVRNTADAHRFQAKARVYKELGKPYVKEKKAPFSKNKRSSDV